MCCSLRHAHVCVFVQVLVCSTVLTEHSASTGWGRLRVKRTNGQILAPGVEHIIVLLKHVVHI